MSSKQPIADVVLTKEVKTTTSVVYHMGDLQYAVISSAVGNKVFAAFEMLYSARAYVARNDWAGTPKIIDLYTGEAI